MKIFAIGDLHLSFDERIDKPMDVFGEAWESHTEKLKQSWLERVGDDDIVIIAGDISWGLRLEEAEADLNWIAGLPGKKLLFKGNHDLWWQSITKNRKLFEKDGVESTDMIFMQNAAFIAGEETGKKIAVCGTRGWICPGTEGFTEHDRKIYEREVMRLGMSLDDAKARGAEEMIAVLHYPPTNDKKQQSDFTRLLTEYGVKLCVYGHLHGENNYRRGITGILSGVSYRLVSLDYLGGCLEELAEI